MRRHKIGLISALFVSSLFASEKPNIIYINADDLGVMDVGFMGRKEYRTPNLDRLAGEGMIFSEAYAPSANCAPSRAACMTGQVAARTGVYTVGTSERGSTNLRKIIPIKNTPYLEDEDVLIPEVLKTGGYKTIHLGKWHLGDDPTTQGFDVNIGGDKTGSPAGGYHSPFKKGSMVSYDKQYPAKTHRCDIFAEEAIKFLNANSATPFFMHMAYYAVHTPLQAVPEMVKIYQDVPGIHAVYASMIEKMDESIGKIINELDRLNLKENTMILFCSDNGGISKVSKQKPYRAGKGSYFEGGIREPMFVRWPAKVKAGSRCDVPVIGLDFFPTFIKAAGLEKPTDKILDGVSLMPLLTQSGTLPKRALYWHFPVYLQKYAGAEDESHDVHFRTRPGSAIRLGKWKLHEYFEDGRLELYNLEADINERRNLATEMPEKAKELHAMLKKWRAEVKAPVPTQLNPKYDPTAKPADKVKNERRKRSK
ncbi:aryl-sulfate sulfohydrolase [bacterium M21]|nr:aryl-sulfate sulfohydrolase [bacterium M21]